MTRFSEQVPSRRGGQPSREVISPRGHWAWKGGGPPHALKLGNVVYVGGQVSLSASGDVIGADNIEVQTANAFTNLTALLHEAGTSMKELMKLHTYYIYRGDGRAATD